MLSVYNTLPGLVNEPGIFLFFSFISSRFTSELQWLPLLSVTYKPFTLSVIVLNVVMLSAVAPP